jgi:uncharacterized protein YozE (UPF0346 family)
MTLIEFLKSIAHEDSPLGDLAGDVMGDKDFPYERLEEDIIAYLEYHTRKGGNSETFDELMATYASKKDEPADQLDLETNYSVLRAEQWNYYKAHFKADRAIIVGTPGDIYRVFAVESKGGKALRFDIYTSRSLNDLSIVGLDQVNNGALTRQVTLAEALEALTGNTFESDRKPAEPNYTELNAYLQSQL